MEKFWLERPRDLLSRANLLPDTNDTFNEKLNTLTKLVIIIAIILAVVGWKHWLTFLVVALLVILFAYLIEDAQRNNDRQGDHDLVEHFNEEVDNFRFYNNAKMDSSPKVTTITMMEKVYGAKLYVDLLEQPSTQLVAAVDGGYADHAVQDTVYPKRKKERKTAYDLAREAIDDDEGVDQVALDRANMINGIF